MKSHSSIKQVEDALHSVIEDWDQALGAITIQTPDEKMNMLTNRWLLYQTMSCRMWARSAFYQSGGAFGLRDQLQDSMVPALVTCAGVVVLIPLSPCLIFGLGPFPKLGVAGGAVAVVIYYGVGSLVLAAYLRSGRSVVGLAFRNIKIRWSLFADILRVGLVAALITVQTNLTIAIATGFVGAFGPAAIAGYGTGSRLEYLLIPLVFGLGGPLVAMVGTNIGAGRPERALRVAWIGAAIGAGLCEIIGFAAAAEPRAWLSLFDIDPAMIDAGSRYLHAVGPVYGLFGLGMALYFASQGAGRLLWPLLANMARLLIAAGGGYLALRWTGNLTDVFIALAVALAAFGVINAAAVASGVWFKGSPAHRPAIIRAQERVN